MKTGKRLALIILCAVLIVPVAKAAQDYLWMYSSWFSFDAVNAALEATPIIKMDAETEAAYRLGFAAGYDTAKEDAFGLIIPDIADDSAIIRTALPNAEEETTETYIVNTETNKFHIPGCSSEKAILPEHRKEVHGSFEEVRQMGYSPCGRCLKNGGK